jgi:hypothetical protein
VPPCADARARERRGKRTCGYDRAEPRDRQRAEAHDEPGDPAEHRADASSDGDRVRVRCVRVLRRSGVQRLRLAGAQDADVFPCETAAKQLLQRPLGDNDIVKQRYNCPVHTPDPLGPRACPVTHGGTARGGNAQHAHVSRQQV